jgi:hypothetical protein
MYNFVDCEPENIELFRESSWHAWSPENGIFGSAVVLRKLCHLTASIMECKH